MNKMTRVNFQDSGLIFASTTILSYRVRVHHAHACAIPGTSEEHRPRPTRLFANPGAYVPYDPSAGPKIGS
jgi:hypothetical protein